MAITISAEDIQNARTYMPLEVKDLVASQIAVWCVQPDKPDAQHQSEDAPPMYHEKRGLRHLLMMGVLARFYLRRDFDTEDVTVTDADGHEVDKVPIDYYMSIPAYNEWAGSFVVNQMERLKKNKEISDRVYDLLYDFKAFENMVYGAIRDEADRRNDPVLRASAYFSGSVSPDYLKSMVDELEEIQNRVKGLTSAKTPEVEDNA